MTNIRLKYITSSTFAWIIIFLLLNSLFSNTYAIPNEFGNAFKKADYKELAKYFNDNIELNIIGSEGIYSKVQAEQILKSFFEKNPVKEFTALFEGGKENGQYAICKLVSSNTTYRVNIFYKSNRILQIRIEIDNGN